MSAASWLLASGIVYAAGTDRLGGARSVPAKAGICSHFPNRSSKPSTTSANAGAFISSRDNPRNAATFTARPASIDASLVQAGLSLVAAAAAWGATRSRPWSQEDRPKACRAHDRKLGGRAPGWRPRKPEAARGQSSGATCPFVSGGGRRAPRRVFPRVLLRPVQRAARFCMSRKAAPARPAVFRHRQYQRAGDVAPSRRHGQTRPGGCVRGSPIWTP